MGRNADKRKARKVARASIEGDAAIDSLADATAEGEPATDWSTRFFAGPDDVPRVEAEGSLARALFHVTALLSLRDATKDPEAHLGRVAFEVARMVEADTVTLLRLSKGDDMVPPRLSLLASYGLAAADRGLVAFDLGDGIAGQVALTGKPVSVADAPRDARFSSLYGQRTELGSLVAVPMTYAGKTLGVLTASRREVRGFHPRDEDTLATVAASIAQDLEQTRFFHDAVHDPATGLYSRLALLSVLPREVETARRYQTGLSLAIVDVDGLAAVNASQGRAGGDRVLAELGRRFVQRVRSADLPVRFGGDEFALLLPMTNAAQAEQAAARLIPLLVQPPLLADAKVTISVGVASLAAADEDALSLVMRADVALATAKRSGGGGVAFAPAELRRDD